MYFLGIITFHQQLFVIFVKFNTYFSVKEGVWLTGEMSDLIKFQFFFKTFISRDDGAEKVFVFHQVTNRPKQFSAQPWWFNFELNVALRSFGLMSLISS